MYIPISQETECCRNCRHYYQHYVRDVRYGFGYTECYDGHCVYPRFKHRKPHDICDRFVAKEEEKEKP